MFKNLKLKIKNSTAYSIIGLIILYLFIPQISHAELIPVCSRTGNCGLCDIVSTAITLGKWLITGAGGLALLVIVWAAFGLVASAGNPDKIGTAKKQIVGAVLGMTITFVAFQMVVMIIAILATPSELATYEGATTKSEESGDYGSLKKFLGVPWWSICSKSDLVEQKGAATGDSTGNCKYWGDDTACEKDKEGNTIKVCCSDYSKETGSSIGRSCTAGTTCPKPPSVQAYFDAQVKCDQENSEKEIQIRNTLTGISINNPNSCGGASYKDYRPACKKGCTSVENLTSSTITKLINLKNVCGAFQITGGSEKGHTAGGSHDRGIGVDINTSIKDCIKDNRRDLGITKICTTAALKQTYSFNCGNYTETEDHLHLEF